MPRIYQLPTSQTTLDDASGVPLTHNLTTLFAAALTASGRQRPGGGSYSAAYVAISNAGAGDAYLATPEDIPAQQRTVTVTVADDGTWIVAFTAPDDTAISSEFEASGDTADEIAAGLRAALTTDCAGHGVTISGATDEIIITADDPLVLFGALTITDPGTGAHTNTDTGSETGTKTNEVIAAGTSRDNPYIFGPYFVDDLPYLRCLADAECSVTFKLEVP